MSVWGKVIGGVAGFAMGGPLGALLGAVAGHAVDKMKAQEAAAGDAAFDGFDQDARQVAFTTAVIALSAKIAKADGRVSADEIAAFKTIFHIPPEETSHVARIWDEAKRDPGGYEPYAMQIAQLFRHEPAVLEEILGALLHIAKADGVVHPAEMELLQRIAVMFGFNAHGFERLKNIHLGADGEDDPYEILSISRDAGDDEIKKTYRKLIRENHPDTLMAQGVPQEFIDLATEKMAAINAAYDRIEKERGLK
jgi:DnaJ like chaperone protein